MGDVGGGDADFLLGAAAFYAALTGRGSYFMPDMDTEAFPPIGETGGVAAIRGAVRTMLGFRRAGG